MKSMHRLLWARYAEVHGKPVGIYFRPNTHTNTCTNRRTNRKHNASNPIYWIGRGMKSKEIQSFSTLNQSAISKLQNRLLTQRVWPRRPTQPPTFKEKEKRKKKRKKIGQSGLRDGKIGTSTSLNLTPAMVLTSQTFPYIITTSLNWIWWQYIFSLFNCPLPQLLQRWLNKKTFENKYSKQF